VVKADSPDATAKEATAKMRRILQSGRHRMEALLRRHDQKSPQQEKSKRFPTTGPLEVTFSGLERHQLHCVAVVVEGLLPPIVATVETREVSSRVEVKIPFAELFVEAQPGFGLYVSRLRGQLAPYKGAPNPDTYIARSGRGGDPASSGYLVGADDTGVRFLYWPVSSVHAVLEAVDTDEDRTDILGFKVKVGEPQEATGKQTKGFGRVGLRPIRAPERPSCSCAREEVCP
jgi:hypothetical protein